MVRCCRCCAFGGSARARKGGDSDSEHDAPQQPPAVNAEFSPKCSCAAFVSTGTCKHIPPPSLVAGDVGSADTNAAGVKAEKQAAPGDIFMPKCSCAAFSAKGTCRHLPPPLPGDVVSEGKVYTTGPPDCATEGCDTNGCFGPPLDIHSDPGLPELSMPPLGLSLRFGEVLGRGASGATVLRCFAASDAVTSPSTPPVDDEILCAAKVLPLAACTFADQVEEFGREVELMRNLRHPGLVGFVGAGKIPAPNELGPLPGVSADTAEAYVLCIELCDLALDSVVQQRRRDAKPFASEELGPLMAQVASGLAYLHQQRILHRDIKAANVFLQYQEGSGEGTEAASLSSPMSEGETRLPGSVISASPRSEGRLNQQANITNYVAKLGDFGGCKLASRAQTPCQTPQWMAPEAARQEVYGPPADIWGLGMLVYELLELGMPYGEEITMPQLEAELVAGRAPLLSDPSGAQERAPDLVALMKQCLIANPTGRPTASEVSGLLASSGWHAPEEETEEEREATTKANKGRRKLGCEIGCKKTRSGKKKAAVKVTEDLPSVYV